MVHEHGRRKVVRQMYSLIRTPVHTFLMFILIASGAQVAQGAQSRLGGRASDQPMSDKARRQKEIERLLAVLRDERLRGNDREEVFKAMRRLGDLKAVVAVDDLIKLLTLPRVFDWETPETVGKTGIEETIVVPANRYPAVDALFLIGKPSLPALVSVIEKRESGSLESENALYAVFAIFRERPQKGASFLRRAAAKAKSGEAARRLLAAAGKDLFS